MRTPTAMTAENGPRLLDEPRGAGLEGSARSISVGSAAAACTCEPAIRLAD